MQPKNKDPTRSLLRFNLFNKTKFNKITLFTSFIIIFPKTHFKEHLFCLSAPSKK